MVPSYIHLFFFAIMLLPLALSRSNCNLDPTDPELQDDYGDDSDHSECHIYRALATELLKDDRNFYNLQKIFFPPNDDSPVFIAVKYYYFDDDNATSAMISRSNTTYFWSSAVYFFFYPVRVLQFSSLLLSDPSLRYGEVNLFLPVKYFDANSDCMVLLTQRVSKKHY